MNNNRGVRIVPSALMAGILAISLGTCCPKNNHTLEQPTVNDTFYDENNEGIDDNYFRLVDNGDSDILELSKIEKLLDVITRIKELDKDIVFDKDNDGLNKYMYLDDEAHLDNITEFLSSIEDKYMLLSPNKHEAARIVLNDCYHQIAGYLLKVAPQKMDKVLLNTAKVIGATTADLDSIDDMDAYIDLHRLTLTGNNYGWYDYNDNGEDCKIRFSSDSSDIYDLINYHLYFKDLSNNQDNDSIKDFDEVLTSYKKSIHKIIKTVDSSYELDDELLQDSKIIKVKK